MPHNINNNTTSRIHMNSDVLSIANAFRQANDTDIMNAMNAFSSKRIHDLTAYIVPMKWMLRACPLLMAHEQIIAASNWREQVGSVENKELLATTTPVDDENTINLELDELMQYARDYVLLGANAWLLVREKFGYDYELKRPCILLDNNSIAVEVIKDTVQIPIPPTGRFPYETMLKMLAPAERMVNVSDDETDGDDLFPNMDDDDRMSMEYANPQADDVQPTVHLLPSVSTLISQYDRTSAPPLGMNDDNFPVEDALVSVTPHRLPYGSGLANLGNTCFMNSSLQCLAHTDPIRKYFLSGEYQKHLNRNNPLGTGGELTVQFAQLLAEMWGTQGTSSYANGYNSHFTNTNPVVYPRNFKYTLGRHAEQFVGYDQHDSQELATYLLDALHEDTNRVTQKPYVEKAEQEVDETDEEAAQKAWALHLKRDNSTVLECFMGQIKSRVQCCKPDCGRVSTTFDPSMYLSVPIPGSSERSLRVIFVSLDPSMRPQEVHVKLDKSSKVSDLLIEFIAQLKTLRLLGPNETIPLEDLCVVDVWQGDVYHYYTEDELIDKIRENDVTFIYQLHPLADIQSREEEIAKKECVDDEKSLGLGDRPTPKRFKLDKYTIHELNRHHKWAAVFEQYLKHPFGFTRAFNPNLGTTDERVKYFKTTSSFVHLCYSTVEAGQKRARDSHYEVPVSVSETLVAGLIDRSDASHYFKDVCNRFDIAILEFCLGKMRSEILNLEGRKRGVFRDGLLQRIRLRTNSGHHAASVHERALFIVAPLILRVSSDTTVYKLRLLLAKRLSRSLKTGRITPAAASGESTSEYAVALRDSMESIDTRYSGLEGQTILRQIPFSYERKTNVSSRSSAFEPLGGLRGNHRGSPAPLASQSDPAEKRLLAGIVDEQGTVFLDWPEDLETRAFDSAEFATIEKPLNPDEIQTAAESTPSDSKDLTVLDCIERYCQIEQLEESDQWYCSRCKEHVRAWKQFHLYRSSPILIIHLKRFQYSASTHRRDKIGIFVDFPLQGLDLTEHVKNWTDGEKPIYDCYGVCNHYGGLGGGHYTAHCLNDDGVWCYYDDSRITTNVDPKDVVSPAAYVLFYRRQDVQVGEDYPISLYPTSAQIPVIIQDPLDTPVYQQDEVSSSNAAMVDEGDMDLDNISDICRTSPVGSIDGGRDQCLEHEYESPGTLDGHLPLQ